MGYFTLDEILYTLVINIAHKVQAVIVCTLRDIMGKVSKI